MVYNKNSTLNGVRCFSRLNLQWYHILIILPANSMITQLQKLWTLFYILCTHSL